DPVFGTFKTTLILTKPTTTSTITFESNGDSGTINFTDYRGIKKKMVFVHTGTTTSSWSPALRTGARRYHVVEGDAVNENDYVLLGSQKNPSQKNSILGHIFKLVDVSNVGYPNATIKLRDVISDDNIVMHLTKGSYGATSFYLDHDTCYVSNTSSLPDSPMRFYWGKHATIDSPGDGITAFPLITTQEGNAVTFIESVEMGNKSGIEYYLPGDNLPHLIKSSTEYVKAGRIEYRFSPGTETTRLVSVNGVDVSQSPAVLILEKEAYNTENVVVGDAVIIPTGKHTDMYSLIIQEPKFTADTTQSAPRNEYITEYCDRYGTYAIYNSEGNGYAKLFCPYQQSVINRHIDRSSVFISFGETYRNCPHDCEKQSCTDSDNGLDYYTKGTATSNIGAILEDSCCSSEEENSCNVQSGDYVSEAYCTEAGDSDTVIFKCPYGCMDGRCVKQVSSCKDSVCTLYENISANLVFEDKEYTIETPFISSDNEVLLKVNGEMGHEGTLVEGQTDIIGDLVVYVIEVNYIADAESYAVVRVYPVCADSDNGKNFYRKGSVTGIDIGSNYTDRKTETDRCDTSNDHILYEYFCFHKDNAMAELAGYFGFETYHCPNGCSDGVCIKGDEPYCDTLMGNEGWYQHNKLIKKEACSGCYAICRYSGTDSEGWYSSCSNSLIKQEICTQNMTCVDKCRSLGYESGICRSWGTLPDAEIGCNADEKNAGETVDCFTPEDIEGVSKTCCCRKKIITCTDTDNGKNIYVKGTLTYGSSNWTDSCIDDHHVL
ncbi:MAG: hypothetical protein DRN08_06540, partial [Thermoplasmata archaeon]